MSLLSKGNQVFGTEAKDFTELASLITNGNLSILAVGLEETITIATNLTGAPVKNSNLTKEISVINSAFTKTKWAITNTNKVLKDLTAALRLRGFRYESAKMDTVKSETIVSDFKRSLRTSDIRLGGASNLLLEIIYTPEAKNKFKNYITEHNDFDFDVEVTLGVHEREMSLAFRNLEPKLFLLFLTKVMAHELQFNNGGSISESQRKIIVNSVKSIVNVTKDITNEEDFNKVCELKNVSVTEIQDFSVNKIKESFSDLYGCVYYLLEKGNMEELKEMSKIIKGFRDKVKLATVGAPYREERKCHPLFTQIK